MQYAILLKADADPKQLAIKLTLASAITPHLYLADLTEEEAQTLRLNPLVQAVDINRREKLIDT